MADKTSYFVTCVFVLVLFLLLVYHQFRHTAEVDQKITYLTKNFVIERTGGAGTTLISAKSMNSLVVAAVTVALYGSTVAVFACLYFRSLIGLDDFEDYDHIVSRCRIRARRNHLPAAH